MRTGIWMLVLLVVISACKQKVTTPNGSIIIDVRTQGEWDADGHADCSELFPLDELSNAIPSLLKYDTIQVVCRSGNRAETAKEMLRAAGAQYVENKGSWQNIICSEL